MDFIAGFAVGDNIRQEILHRLTAPTTPETSETMKAGIRAFLRSPPPSLKGNGGSK